MCRAIRYGLLHLNSEGANTAAFIDLKTTNFLIKMPTLFMWAGAATIALAIIVNVQQVLGDISFCVAIDSSVMLVTVILVAFIGLERLRNKYHVGAKVDD